MQPPEPRKPPVAISRAALESLQRGIEHACGHPIELHINNNSSTLITLRFPRGRLPRLSLHHMFLGADAAVVRALGQYVKRPTPASRMVLRQFMAAQGGKVRPSAARLRLRSKGVHYDLHHLAMEVNREYFAGAIRARITWSRGQLPTRGRRHIQFGCYDGKLGIVRIHPALDSADVPEYFVRFIIFHEMLHAELEPLTDADGRRYFHTAEFRKRERSHPDYERVKAWEKEFLKTF
jgi:hypothetical protein